MKKMHVDRLIHIRVVRVRKLDRKASQTDTSSKKIEGYIHTASLLISGHCFPILGWYTTHAAKACPLWAKTIKLAILFISECSLYLLIQDQDDTLLNLSVFTQIKVAFLYLTSLSHDFFPTSQPSSKKLI